jgi:protein ImuB
MAFASICVPDFMVQSVVRAEPALRGCAIALIEGTPPLCKVVAANEAAWLAGIEPGMNRSQAADFGAVEIRPRSPVQEKAAHAALLDLGWSVSPRVEDAARDAIILDLAGLASIFGPEEKIAAQLVEHASKLGLIANVAVASNIESALHAARGFPGITVIPPGEEAERLGCLPVSALLPSAEILETLERWGVRNCAALAALPVLELSERLGQEGVRLHELARGARERSLTLAEPALFFEEEMELDDSVEELEPLAFLLGRLLDHLCARLATRSLAASAIQVRFDLEPSFEKDFRLLSANSLEKNAPKTYRKVLALPVPMRDSKMLLKLLRLHLQRDPPLAPILKITMAADPARSRVAQGGLFLPASPDPEKLELTVARIANLVGDANIGSPESMDTHRPDEFRMSRFATSHGAAENRRKNGRGTSEAGGENGRHVRRKSGTVPAIAFRVFRPSVPASVELCEGRPVRVGFRGMRGDVVTASGPWRTSGDWWREDGWQQDEWDLEIRFHSSRLFAGASQAPGAPERLGINLKNEQSPKSAKALPQCGLYRFYYDSILQSWFVRGMYD